MILGIHHVQITVPKGSEAAARAFYNDLLGLVEVAKPAVLVPRGGFWLAAGALQLHVGVEDGVERGATKAHVAYEVRDLGAWRARLKRAGIEILPGIRLPGIERFEFRDPFGNRVEFIERLRDGEHSG